jgi:hypothetical protein
MNETEEYVAEHIRRWVWSGFYGADDIVGMIDDILEEDCDEAMLKALVEPELARKQQAERAWPPVTDCERLDKVFYHLHEAGICALSNAGYTMSDGHTDVDEAVAGAPQGHYHGYCFYHGQDVERAVDGQGVMIAFGDLRDDPVSNLEVGRSVAAALTAAGFVVEWNGTMKTRINIPAFNWQRRSPAD